MCLSISEITVIRSLSLPVKELFSCIGMKEFLQPVCLLLVSNFLLYISSCSSKKAKSSLYSFMPILKWLPRYPVKEYLLGDIISGVSTGIMQLPQGEYTSIFNYLFLAFSVCAFMAVLGILKQVLLKIGCISQGSVWKSAWILQSSPEW